MMNGSTPHSIQFGSVADLYDIYVRADFDIPFWLQESRTVSGKALELTCGTGRVSLPLIKAGLKLTCVDKSPEMIAQFRRKLHENNLSCPIYCQDMTELNLHDRFDLIFIPFHSFSEIVDRHGQRLALHRIRSHLSLQGTFICTLQNPAVRTSTMDGTLRLIGEFPAPGGGRLIVRAGMIFDPSTQIASGEQVYEQLSPDGNLVARRVLGINFYLFRRDEFELLLTECGFSVESVYGDYDRAPFQEATSPYMIWKARRSTAARGSHRRNSA